MGKTDIQLKLAEKSLKNDESQIPNLITEFIVLRLTMVLVWFSRLFASRLNLVLHSERRIVAVTWNTKQPKTIREKKKLNANAKYTTIRQTGHSFSPITPLKAFIYKD